MSSIYGSNFITCNDIINKIIEHDNKTMASLTKISSDILALNTGGSGSDGDNTGGDIVEPDNPDNPDTPIEDLEDELYNPYNTNYNPVYKINIPQQLPPNHTITFQLDEFYFSTNPDIVDFNLLQQYKKINDLDCATNPKYDLYNTQKEIYLYIPRPFYIKNINLGNMFATNNPLSPIKFIRYDDKLNCSIYQILIFKDCTTAPYSNKFYLPTTCSLAYADKNSFISNRNINQLSDTLFASPIDVTGVTQPNLASAETSPEAAWIFSNPNEPFSQLGRTTVEQDFGSFIIRTTKNLLFVNEINYDDNMFIIKISKCVYYDNDYNYFIVTFELTEDYYNTVLNGNRPHMINDFEFLVTDFRFKCHIMEDN